MNKKQLSALMAVNLRLVNPQITDRFRKKGKNGQELTKRLQLQFLLNALIFLGIYGVSMLSFNFSKLPGMFTFYVGIFILLGISQSISGIYNIFFGGKDLASYLPLPFQSKEIFLSKILIVTFSVIPFTMPLLIAFCIAGWRSGLILPIAILYALLAYLIIISIILLVCSLFVFGLTKTKIFREHQNLVMNGLITITMVIALGGVLLINRSSSATGADRPVISILMPIFKIFNKPSSMISLLTWISMIVVLLALTVLISFYILPHLNEQLTQANTSFLNSSKRRKGIRHQGLKKNLNAYNFQLLKEPNLILQVTMNSVLIPLIFIISFSVTEFSTSLSSKWVGVFFVSGIVFSLFTTNQAALVANLISLDRDNFDFVESLPISMKSYLKQKFQFGYLIQLLLNLIMILIMAVMFKFKWFLLIAMILGTSLGTYFVCLHYFRRDFRLRLTTWTNVTELFNRGGGNLVMVAGMFINIIIGVVVIAAYSIAIYSLKQSELSNIFAVILVAIGAILLLRHYQRGFWSQFE